MEPWKTTRTRFWAVDLSAPVDFVDTFFRFAAIGQLMLILVVLIRMWRLTIETALLLSLCPAVTAYLLLTAPIGDLLQDFRGVLMTLTHAVPYLLWVLGLRVFADVHVSERWRVPAIAFVAVFVLWHVYFFGFLEGQGLFHDISHGLYLILFGHLVYLAVRGLTDDLVEPRIKARVLLIAAFSLQLLFITAAELGVLAFADERWLDTINSGLLLLITTLVATHLSSSTNNEILTEPTAVSGTGGIPRESKVPVEDSALHQALMDFMDSGAYRQTNLTIGQLAKELRTPEHRLRHLINGHLGFRNFSTFLSTYRIREACERLADVSQRRIPILTIALELGYGSVGPFNRAFRALVGRTPTEFRRDPSDPGHF